MIRTFAALLAIVALDASSAPAGEGSNQQPGPKNLVRHASLEAPIGANGLPDGWGGTHFEPDKSYKVLVVDGGRTGERSLVIEGKGRFGVASTNKVLIDRNARYRARGWVRIEGDAAAAADVKFHYFDANHQYLGQTRIPFVSPPAKNWTLVEVTDRASDFPKAKWIQVAVALAGNGKAQFDDLELTAHPRDEVPDDFDLPPKLKVLNQWVGAWEGELTLKSAEWLPEGSKSRYTESIDWVLGRRFIQNKAILPTPNGTMEFLWLTTYDSKEKVYRHWVFDSNGYFPRTEMTGQWDEDTRTLTWKAVGKDRVTTTNTTHFIDKDTYQQTFVNKGPDGKVLLDMETKSTRRK